MNEYEPSPITGKKFPGDLELVGLNPGDPLYVYSEDPACNISQWSVIKVRKVCDNICIYAKDCCGPKMFLIGPERLRNTHEVSLVIEGRHTISTGRDSLKSYVESMYLEKFNATMTEANALKQKLQEISKL